MIVLIITKTINTSKQSEAAKPTVFEKFVLLCVNSLDRIGTGCASISFEIVPVSPFFAETLARSKILVVTLFLSPSFLYLYRFVRKDFCGRIFVQTSLGRDWLRVLWVNRV